MQPLILTLLLISTILLFLSPSCIADKIISVDNYGAFGNGVHNDKQAFVTAWEDACRKSGSSVIQVPKGKRYLLSPIHFKGPCQGSITMEIAGDIMAPRDIWDPKTSKFRWIYFNQVRNLTLQGGGTLNGNGQKWWIAKDSKMVKKAPTAVSFYFSKNIIMRNLTFLNSQQIHLNIQSSQAVLIEKINITAPGDSPNTDGVHIGGGCKNITVSSSFIGTGDDCVSIVSASSMIRVYDIDCGPGHGISIGSLGKDGAKAFVSDVEVNGARLTNTTNGARIKTWKGGSGFAKNISFMNIVMNNVRNPIIIDQSYCDNRKPESCIERDGAVKISNIKFSNITGTSASNEAVKLECSKSVACSGIVLDFVRLVKLDGAAAKASCQNAKGKMLSSLNPTINCLKTT